MKSNDGTEVGHDGRTTRRKLALSLAAVGVAVGLAGAGTFATFSAQSTNPGNTFATGTIVLSNTANSGTACLSTAGATTDTNSNGSCDTLFNLTVKKPGDSGDATIAVRNAGSLAASTFNLFSSACTAANATGENYNGTGNPCSSVQVYVQEFSDSAFTTASSCKYGGGTATACAFDSTKTLADFVTSHGSSSTGASLGSLAAGATKYYKIGVQLPSSAGNTLQGRSASLGFNWYATQ